MCIFHHPPIPSSSFTKEPGEPGVDSATSVHSWVDVAIFPTSKSTTARAGATLQRTPDAVAVTQSILVMLERTKKHLLFPFPSPGEIDVKIAEFSSLEGESAGYSGIEAMSSSRAYSHTGRSSQMRRMCRISRVLPLSGY